MKRFLIALLLIPSLVFAGNVYNIPSSVPAPITSALNKTTTPLSSGGVYTGSWEDVSGHSSLIVSVKTDQNGTYTIQFSPDGVNADSTLTRYYRTDQIEPPHRFTITRKYARITFTNTSASAQTYLRLQTTYGEHENLNIPNDTVMSQDYDSISVRPTEYITEVAIGRRQGASLFNKFGRNNDIDTTTDPEVLAAFGGTFTPMTTAATLNIVSSSPQDFASGHGARSILITGLDGSRKEQTETVALTGTVAATSSNTWLGINRVVVTSSGTSQYNVGNITITENGGATNQAYIPATDSVTQQCIYHNEADHKAIAKWLLINTLKQSGGNPKVQIRGLVYSPITATKYEVYRHDIDTSVENTIELVPPIPFQFTEKDVFWLEATTDRDDTVINCRFSVVEIQDVDSE